MLVNIALPSATYRATAGGISLLRKQDNRLLPPRRGAVPHLAAAQSRSGENNALCCFLTPSRRFATLKDGGFLLIADYVNRRFFRALFREPATLLYAPLYKIFTKFTLLPLNMGKSCVIMTLISTPINIIGDKQKASIFEGSEAARGC